MTNAVLASPWREHLETLPENTLIPSPQQLMDKLNASFVFPGQPLVLALMVMVAFSRLDKATAGDVETPAALCHRSIPGLHSSVSSALVILRDGVDFSLDANIMIQALEAAWRQQSQRQEPVGLMTDYGLTKSAEFHEVFAKLWPAWRENSETS